jgi:hypothetical protein
LPGLAQKEFARPHAKEFARPRSKVDLVWEPPKIVRMAITAQKGCVIFCSLVEIWRAHTKYHLSRGPLPPRESSFFCPLKPTPHQTQRNYPSTTHQLEAPPFNLTHPSETINNPPLIMNSTKWDVNNANRLIHRDVEFDVNKAPDGLSQTVSGQAVEPSYSC